ncbi:MAG: septum formation initiator family protein [Bacillota bacterium]|nr:septum formation initiator family protein [Bacillota bacterium]
MSKTRRSVEFKNNSRVIDIDEAREKRQAKRKSQREALEKKQARRNKKPETRGKRAIRRKKNRNRLMAALLILLVTIFLACWGFKIVSLINEKHDVNEQKEALKHQKTELEQKLADADDKETLEDIAREKLRLIKPGEILYMFPSDFNDSSKGDDNGED